MKREKVSTKGGQPLCQNPFAALSGDGLVEAVLKASESKTPAKNRARVDIKHTAAGRSNKTVTLVTGFVGIGFPEKRLLAKKMRAVCGCGGTVKNGDIQIQGEQRKKIAQILVEAGFRPVFADG